MITNYKTPVLVDGTVTTIPSGTQDVNVLSPDPLPVSPEKAFTATTVPIVVTAATTVLLGTNANRRGLIIQTNNPIFVLLDGNATTTLYSYEMPKKVVVEIENYCGPITA